MAPRMRKFLARDAETSIRQPMPLLCCRFAFPRHLDAELSFGTGRGDEGPRLSGEFQAELDLDPLRSIAEVAKLAGHGDRRRLDRLDRCFKSIVDRLAHLAGMQRARYRPPGLLHLNQNAAAGFQREGDEALHEANISRLNSMSFTPFLTPRAIMASISRGG